jgi:putative phage-type endonuclease
MDRKGFIGGSDIAAVMGVSRWKTPLQLWAEKTGQVEPEDISTKEYVELGSELEDFIAKRFEKVTGIKVRQAPQLYKRQDFPWMACQVDRLVTGTDELLECKNASAWKEKEWEGQDIPVEYILQVSWQLMVTGRKVGYIAVLIGGNKFIWKKIEADEELFGKMKDAAIAFWEMVEKKIPPVAEAADNRFMVELYPTGNSQMKEATQDVVDAVKMLQQTKAQIIEMERTKDEIEAKIKAVIADANGIITPEFTIKWINVKGSTYTVTKPDSRQLRVTKNKGA